MSKFIQIEGKNYPKLILGGDRFLGWFGGGNDTITSELYVSSIMEKCYQIGVRGFDMSVKEEVINSFNSLKRRHPEVVGIGNPNWKCGVHLNGKPLMEFPERIISTMFGSFSDSHRKDVGKLGYPAKKWFSNLDKSLSSEEISAIEINYDVFEQKVQKLKECDFCLIGPNPLDCLVILERTDLIRKLIDIVRKHGLIPLGLSHLTAISIPKMDKLDFAGYWTWINKEFQFPNEDDAWKAIGSTSRPVTAMKVLAGGKISDIEGAISYIKKNGAEAINLGVETKEQAIETFGIAQKYY